MDAEYEPQPTIDQLVAVQGRVTLSMPEHQELLSFVQGYYRLLAEDEGTWADWARRLADALEYVLNNPRGGYEQADAYIKAQGVGATVLAEYRTAAVGETTRMSRP